jgi:protein phosphatase methylesterase 1
MVVKMLTGKTRPMNESVSDEELGIETLTQDFVNLLTKIFADVDRPSTLLASFQLNFTFNKADLSLKLVGHSMGGAVVTRACPLLLERKFSITGVVVLDVVEGICLPS